MDTAISLDRVVQAYNAIRDARTVKRHAWEKADLELENEQNILKRLLLDILNKNGAKSIATEHGTAIRSEKVKPSAADWGAIWDWAKEHDGFEIVEKRLKSTFIQQYMEENGGVPPPGVNVHREFEVSVRRPNVAKEEQPS